MSSTMREAADPTMAAGSIGARVLCGVDGTPEGLAAAHQAARLVDPAGSLTLLASYNSAAAAEAGYLASRTAEQLEHDAREALHDAATIRAASETRLAEAAPHAALDAEARRVDATLLVVGTHELSRRLGILLGSVATTSVHMPARATLIARDTGAAPERFPRAIAVGEDGSPSSKHARTVASALAERFDVPFRRVLCSDDGDPDLDVVHEVAGPVEVLRGKAQHELVRISEELDLLVVGASGRRGLRALGSVSERVAHKAHCSVLVVPLPPTETP